MNGDFDQEREAAPALAGVRECANTMASEAEGLQRALPDLVMEEALRRHVVQWGNALQDTAQRVLFEVALLNVDSGEGRADLSLLLRRLSSLDAAMMDVVAASTDLVERLERAAERDESKEPSFIVVIEIVARLMTACESAQVATRALQDAMPRRGRAVPQGRRTADGSLVVLEVGAEGGSLTLVGRKSGGSEWQFARITLDQSEPLFGEVALPVKSREPVSLDWANGWEAGLSLMDRYPWVRLSPQYLHPDFVERVLAAVEERLKGLDPDSAERAREKWEWRIEQSRAGREKR